MFTEEQLNIIKSYFGKCTSASITEPRVSKFCLQYPEINQEIEKILKETPEFLSKRNVIYAKVNEVELKRCPTCNKILPFKKTYRTEFFSNSCAIKSDKVQNKIRKTSLERYGVEYPTQAESTKKKIKSTNLKHYGVESALSAKEVRDKIKSTNLEKYGGITPRLL